MKNSKEPRSTFRSPKLNFENHGEFRIRCTHTCMVWLVHSVQFHWSLERILMCDVFFFYLTHSIVFVPNQRVMEVKKRKNNFLLVCQLLRIDTNGIACMSVYTQWNTTHNSDTHRNKKKNFFCPSSLSSIFFISNIRCNTKEETRKNRTKLIKKKRI